MQPPRASGQFREVSVEVAQNLQAKVQEREVLTRQNQTNDALLQLFNQLQSSLAKPNPQSLVGKLKAQEVLAPHLAEDIEAIAQLLDDAKLTKQQKLPAKIKRDVESKVKNLHQKVLEEKADVARQLSTVEYSIGLIAQAPENIAHIQHAASHALQDVEKSRKGIKRKPGSDEGDLVEAEAKAQRVKEVPEGDPQRSRLAQDALDAQLRSVRQSHQSRFYSPSNTLSRTVRKTVQGVTQVAQNARRFLVARRLVTYSVAAGVLALQHIPTALLRVQNIPRPTYFDTAAVAAAVALDIIPRTGYTVASIMALLEAPGVIERFVSDRPT